MDYTIARDEHGAVVATNPGMPVVSFAVTPDGEKPRIFHRRAQKFHPDGTTDQVTWLVMELDGVRVYYDGAGIVVTKQDINP